MEPTRGETTQPAAKWHEIAGSPEFVRLEALRRRITVALLGVFAIFFGSFLICCSAPLKASGRSGILSPPGERDVGLTSFVA